MMRKLPKNWWVGVVFGVLATLDGPMAAWMGWNGMVASWGVNPLRFAIGVVFLVFGPLAFLMGPLFLWLSYTEWRDANRPLNANEDRNND